MTSPQSASGISPRTSRSTSRRCIDSATSERSSPHVARGSHQGFDAEWRDIGVVTVDGDMINRYELFDEADLDAALARFDELPPRARLTRKRSKSSGRTLRAYFAARDWTAMAEILADEICNDDRRRVVNAGIRRGRDAEIANMRAIAEIGVTNTAPTSLRPVESAWP